MKSKCLRTVALWLAIVLVMPGGLALSEDRPDSGKKDVPAVDSYAPKKPQVETVADTLEYSRDQKKVIAKGNVVIRYGNTQLTADYAEVETDSKQAYAYGHVIVFQNGKETTKAEEIYYDFETETGSIPKARHLAPPWFLRADEVQQTRPGVKTACRGGFTTCNMDDPYYEVKAKKMIIYENDKIIAQDVTIYIHKIAVFWLPYLIVPIDWLEVPVSVSAGYYSRWGYYILFSKRLHFTPNVGGRLYLDWRSKRGFASGFDLDYDYGPRARGIVETYLAFDEEAPNAKNDEDPFGETRRKDRGRITWRHRTDFDDYSYLLLRYNRLADEYFLQEFFEKEFRNEVEPQSYMTFTKNGPRYGFYAMGQKKMNDFERIVEKLPQVRFNWRNQPLVKIPKTDWMTYYESEISAANFYKAFGRDENFNHTNRVELNNAFMLPLQWNGIKFTPMTNWDNTYYSRTRDHADAKLRTILSGGADLRTQAYHLFPVTFHALGMEINQIRHILEPSVTYQSTWSSLSTEQLVEYDHRDMIDSSNRVRLGLENRFQTKRVVRGRVQRVDFLSLNSYLTYDLTPDSMVRDGIFAPFDDGKYSRKDGTFTLFSQEIAVRPYNWLQYELRADFDTRRAELRAATQDVKVQLPKQVSLVFGHRFAQRFLDQQSVNQFVFDGTWTVNSLWDLGGYIRWDTQTMELEEWQVKGSRRLACEWVLDFGYNVRNSDIQDNNKTLFFDFYLAPLPEVGIKTGPNRASFGAPVIGDTIAGANAAYSISPTPYDSRERRL
ncbi:MAG: LPS assembly protein LptD [Candidatus Omnitrophota bacterium]|jgi:lipopolysaccharide assembly outer membrane protein LptD (OstA)